MADKPYVKTFVYLSLTQYDKIDYAIERDLPFVILNLNRQKYYDLQLDTHILLNKSPVERLNNLKGQRSTRMKIKLKQLKDTPSFSKKYPNLKK